MKRLMILGAGHHQLISIKKAIDLGFYVITVDNVSDNVGHKYSHNYVNCSVIDEKCVLKTAEALNIDGIATFAEIATPTVAFVVEQLGLAGSPLSSVENMLNKAKFRACQQKNNVNHPQFVSGNSFDAVAKEIEEMSLPLMFKPVDGTSSRGITKINSANYNKFVKAFEFAQNYSRSKTVCIEEYLDGIDVGGDGFMLNGELVFASITHKHKNNHLSTGHSLPTNIDVNSQQKVYDELGANCRGAGYTDGPIDFDVMVSPDQVSVIEINPRLGANGIPSLIKRATGVDLIAATLNFAVGNTVDFSIQNKDIKSCGSWVFGSNFAGQLEKMATFEELKQAVPEIYDYVTFYNPGDKVPKSIPDGNSLGYLYFDCPSQSDYSQIVTRLKDAIQLRISQQ